MIRARQALLALLVAAAAVPALPDEAAADPAGRAAYLRPAHR